MLQRHSFDPAARRREKQHMREADDAALRRGDVSAEELSSENNFFSSLRLSRGSFQRRHARV